MKITFQGFELQPGAGITLSEFADLLSSASSPSEEYSFGEHQRLFLFEKESDPNYYTGLLITAKDQKTFAELKKQKGKLMIKVSELEEGSRLMDFNFFVLNKKTFRGVYQHYNASCSPMRFGAFLRYFFWSPEKKRRISLETDTLVKSGRKPDRAEAIAKRKFKGLLKLALFYKPEDFAKILKTMKQVRQFHFDIATASVQKGVFSPDIPVKGVQERVVFERPDQVVTIADALGVFVKAKKITKAKAIALDPDGDIKPIYLNKNIEGFGEFDFDEVMADMAFEVESYAKSPLIKKLLLAARANKIFSVQ